MKKGVMLTVTIVISVLMLSFIAFPLSATAQGPDSTPEKVQVVSVLGKIPGRDLIVHIWVVVPPGADKNEAANEALRNQGARPFTQDEFSTISLFWDQFLDGNPENDFVIQNYNPKNDPTNDQGKTTLLKTHATWNGVVTSIFNYAYGEDTNRCPSLVRECPGRQTFDGNNDVAWLALKDKNVLAVTWSGTSIDEADMALNTKFTWNTNGNNFDVETVYLHENGHVLGLGHSTVVGAVMEAVYDGERRILHQDDIDGISFLYPGESNSLPIVTIINPTDGSTYGSGATINFEGTASDAEDGDLTASLVWTSDIDGQIGTGGSFSTTLNDATHTITTQVTDSGGATASSSITITITASPPTLVSISISPVNPSITEGSTQQFTATGTYSDDTNQVLTDVTWSSSLTTIATIDGGGLATGISEGSTTITAISGGQEDTTILQVIVAPEEPTTASVSSITYSTHGGKDDSKHLDITITIINDFANPVSGASVSIELLRDGRLVGQGTGTTATDGTITFSLKNAASGFYTTDVTGVTASGLIWDGITPSNGFNK
ncbi:MAG: Ig-like domain-containing protein [Thaumarchaeota archaeon]|nr:Ig-like domain-containing protein [Nitrososphaerota archaeon]